MVESNKAIHFLVQVTITRCELVLEDPQDEVIHLVAAMRVRRMTLWSDLSRVVVQNVEHEMRFVLVGTDDLGIDRHMVSRQGVGTHAFLQAKILAGVLGIDGVDLCLNTLTVTAGMYLVVDISRNTGNAAVALAIASFAACKVSTRRKLRAVVSNAELLSPETSAIFHKPIFVPMATMQASMRRGSASCLT